MKNFTNNVSVAIITVFKGSIQAEYAIVDRTETIQNKIENKFLECVRNDLHISSEEEPDSIILSHLEDCGKYVVSNDKYNYPCFVYVSKPIYVENPNLTISY